MVGVLLLRQLTAAGHNVTPTLATSYAVALLRVECRNTQTATFQLVLRTV